MRRFGTLTVPKLLRRRCTKGKSVLHLAEQTLGSLRGWPLNRYFQATISVQLARVEASGGSLSGKMKRDQSKDHFARLGTRTANMGLRSGDRKRLRSSASCTPVTFCPFNVV